MALDRKWEKFQGGPARSAADQVRVTINRKGLIYLNTKAYEALGRPKAVALFYNREDDQIAIQPAYERFVEHFLIVKKPRAENRKRLLRRLDACDQFFET